MHDECSTRPDRSEDPLEAAARLDGWFEACPSAAVAFSGGVDSALVAFWARWRLGRERCTAWTADSPSLKRSDLEIARAFCAAHDIPMQLLATRELDDPDYASNPFDRCFHCKKTLYGALLSQLGGLAAGTWVLSGANTDDQGDHRPGLVAAANASVRHPLLECGIGKDVIRQLARRHGLALWDKPASPCLSSRIPYGQPVTAEKLRQIEAGEAWLQASGFAICRVRHHGGVARIEVPVSERGALERAWPQVQESFARIGFARVEIDAEGFVSGKMNRAIPGRGAAVG